MANHRTVRLICAGIVAALTVAPSAWAETTSTQPAATESGEPHHPVGQAPSQEKSAPAKAVSAVLSQPGILTPRGKFVLEPSLQFSYSSNYQVNLIGYTIIPAITIGLINIQSVNQNNLVAQLTARYGVTNRFELYTQVPYVYRKQTTLARPLGQGSTANSEFKANGYGVGDVQVGMRYQFNEGGAGEPYYIGALAVKTRTGKGPFSVPYISVPGVQNALEEDLPTGSGFYAVQPSLTVIYPSSPAVLFGGVSYLWNFKRDIHNNQIDGTVSPGDAFSLNFGMGIALNAKTSLSLGYKHTVVGQASVNGTVLQGSQTTQLGTLLVGYSYQASPSTDYNLTLGAGLTRYTPDVELTLRVPVTL
ncbi:MAG: acetate kinase [Gammaproteobacteria bacterium]